MFDATDQFAKGTKAIMHCVALLEMKVSDFCKANKALICLFSLFSFA
jgi:hypothetical protein